MENTIGKCHSLMNVNKKFLLRECRRHTYHGISSTPCAVLSWRGVVGTLGYPFPHQTWLEGVGNLGYPPIRPDWGGRHLGVPPSDLARGRYLGVPLPHQTRPRYPLPLLADKGCVYTPCLRSIISTWCAFDRKAFLVGGRLAVFAPKFWTGGGDLWRPFVAQWVYMGWRFYFEVVGTPQHNIM